MCSEQDPLSLFEGLQIGILGFSQKETGAESVAMATTQKVSVSFVMHIFGAKFEEHCSNISRDILDSVFYCSNGTTYGVITFLICIIFSRTKKDIPRRETPFPFTLKSLSNKQQLFFTS